MAIQHNILRPFNTIEEYKKLDLPLPVFNKKKGPLSSYLPKWKSFFNFL